MGPAAGGGPPPDEFHRPGLPELLFFRGPLERGGGRLSSGDRHLQGVEVSRPDEALMLDRRIPLLPLPTEVLQGMPAVAFRKTLLP